MSPRDEQVHTPLLAPSPLSTTGSVARDVDAAPPELGLTTGPEEPCAAPLEDDATGPWDEPGALLEPAARVHTPALHANPT